MKTKSNGKSLKPKVEAAVSVASSASGLLALDFRLSTLDLAL